MLQVCSKDRDPTGDITEPEGLDQRCHLDALPVGEVVDEEATVGAQAVRGPGGAEVKEGEGEREGAGEGGEGSPEGGGEG